MKWVTNVDKYRKIKFCCLQSKAAEPYLEYSGVTREEVLRRFVLVEGPGSCYQASTDDLPAAAAAKKKSSAAADGTLFGCGRYEF
ncbi:hypothetical protein Scep_026740 [Stephania cephalantha]|uniref:Uncharacterized protein n=1 Tax=Stephania cephalantha TaxID=152367 RepID=A0AAP0EKQ8_9MAGN